MMPISAILLKIRMGKSPVYIARIMLHIACEIISLFFLVLGIKGKWQCKMDLDFNPVHVGSSGEYQKQSTHSIISNKWQIILISVLIIVSFVTFSSQKIELLLHNLTTAIVD